MTQIEHGSRKNRSLLEDPYHDYLNLNQITGYGKNRWDLLQNDINQMSKSMQQRQQIQLTGSDRL